MDRRRFLRGLVAVPVAVIAAPLLPEAARVSTPTGRPVWPHLRPYQQQIAAYLYAQSQVWPAPHALCYDSDRRYMVRVKL